MAGRHVINVGIDKDLLKRVDAFQPSHLTRKGFICGLIDASLDQLEAEQLRRHKALQKMQQEKNGAE